MIADTFRTLYQPGDVCEVRALLRGPRGLSPFYDGWSSGIVYGYFDNGDALESAVVPLDESGLCSGIYVTLNPVQPDLMARAMNRLRGLRKKDNIDLAADVNIVRRRWILIDVDPTRSIGKVDVSSTDEELRLSVAVAKQVREYNRAKGLDDPRMALSGNGVHLLYPVDLPNDEDTKLSVQLFLNQLYEKFSTPQVKVDISVFNAARITKLYGTVARKGDDHPLRPWRRSELIPVK